MRAIETEVRATDAARISDAPAGRSPRTIRRRSGTKARRTDAPDPQLLALVGQVLTWLPLIATHDRVHDQGEGIDAVRGAL